MQTFDTVDVLRLEIEDDPTGLANLVPNPSGDLGGWGWSTPLANTKMGGDASGLTYTSTAVGIQVFTTERMPIAAGQYAAASWSAISASHPSLNVYNRVRFNWYNAAGALLSSSTYSAYYLASTAADRTYNAVVAPASTAYFALEFVLTRDTSGNALNAVGSTTVVKFNKVTVAKAATSGALQTVRTNLLPNPSMETNTTGWFGGFGVTIARSTAQFDVGVASLLVQRTVAGGNALAQTTPPGSSGIPVTGGETYTLRLRVRAATVARSVVLGVRWYDAAGASISGTDQIRGTDTTSGWTTLSRTMTAPSNATRAAVTFGTSDGAVSEVHYFDALMFEKATSAGTYFSGATAAGGGHTYAWTGTANASTSTDTVSTLAFIEPVPYVNVLGPTYEIKSLREVLNLGTLTATILDSSLDPSQDDLIRPGRRVRLSVTPDGGATWEPIFTGTVTKASVTYYVKDPAIPEQKRARIVLTAVDPLAPLANQKRAEGVGTIDDLPYVLEGAGVPWNVNGSGAQVPGATVVAINENASAVDQVAITRDSNLGYAWVDRHGTVQVWDRAAWFASAGYGVGATDDLHSDLDLSYDTDDCINEVTIKFLRLNPTTGETEEIPYGPYRDETSIGQWGVRSAEFTVQGISEETVDLDDFAQAILDANGTPQVRVNSCTVPVTSTALITAYGWPYLDLYVGLNVNGDTVLVTSIEQTITPEKWLIRFGFGLDSQVAAPTYTPSPQTGAGGKTIGELLQPPGMGELWFGSVAPPGWLLCDGASYAVVTYPKLFAAIGYTWGGSGANFNVPNLVDRFPIGAGSKALGTSGGDATKTIAAANLPAHNHPITSRTGATAFGAAASVAIPSTTGTLSTQNTQNNTGGGTPLDVMNPWRAINFIIRAV